MALNLFSNGKSDDELRAENAARNLHQTQLNQGHQQGAPNREYLREITDEQLDEQTYELMQNLFSHDFVLSNLEDAEVTEQKWLARVVAMKIKRMHPPAESFVTGRTRQFVFDDDDSLRPLDPHQETLIDQAVLQFITRPPRSRDGWQQDEVGKTVSVSRVEDENAGGGGGGLFKP
jgi:hypothetical protein